VGENSCFLQSSTAENLIANGLSVMVYLLGLRCWLADSRIRDADATAEFVSCSATAAVTRY